MNKIRARFPGLADGWARFDGPAGTQMVDSAIDAMADFARSGNNANAGGFFPAAQASGQVLDRARNALGRLLGAEPEGIVLGPNMTSLTFAFTRAVARTLTAEDRVVGTQLDHDANVTPWALACADAGAEHALAPFDPATGRLEPEAVIGLIDDRTRWVAITGASNLLGTTPDLAPVIDAAHAQGAKVFVDAVHLAPHRRIDLAALGADVVATSPYKWYGPHAGVLAADPQLLAELQHYKVRPAPPAGPRAWETGTPSFEAIAAVEAAARFLIEEDMDRVAAAEAAVFAPLLEGLLGDTQGPGVGCPDDGGPHANGGVHHRRRPPRRGRQSARRRPHRHLERPQLCARGGRPARPGRVRRRRPGRRGSLHQPRRGRPPPGRGHRHRQSRRNPLVAVRSRAKQLSTYSEGDASEFVSP